MTILDKDRQKLNDMEVIYKGKKGGEFMRISNLIMQSLIAGAVLFIPVEVFAEKEDVEKRNQTTERSNQKSVQQGKTTDRVPVRATKQLGTELKTKPSEVKDKKPEIKGSEKRSETKLSKQVSISKQKNSQNANDRIRVKKSVPQRQTKEHVPMKQTERVNQDRSHLKKAESSIAIHRKTVIHKSLSLKETEKVLKMKPIPLKENGSRPQVKKDASPLSNNGSSKVPTHPVSKVIPATTGQGSSPPTNQTDGGAGTASLANFKASLVLPIIFEEGEKISVYFSRMDLLRSQWVNAPPARPPENALYFFKKIVV